MELSNTREVPTIGQWRTLPREHKLHWLPRLGVIGCFIGYGAYGFLTKAAWVSYLDAVSIDRAWAYRLMPWIGIMNLHKRQF